MSQYKETLADGTVRIVKYDPRHDGPVSERLTLLRKVRFFQRKIRRYPGDPRHRDGLRSAQETLSLFDKSAHQRPQKRNWQHSLNQNNGRKRNHHGKRRDARSAEQTLKPSSALDTAAPTTTLATSGVNIRATLGAGQRESAPTLTLDSSRPLPIKTVLPA